MSVQRFASAMLMGGCLAVSGAVASAATSYTWTGASDTFYSNAGNWTPGGGPPVAGDTANFSSNATVDFSAAAASAQLIQSGSVSDTFNLAGNAYLTTGIMNPTSISAGSTLLLDGGGVSGSILQTNGPSDFNQYGSLTVQNGAVYDQLGGGRPYIRGAAHWIVTGAGSAITMHSGAGMTFAIGENSYLTVTDGGTVTMPGAFQAANPQPISVGGGSGTSTLTAGAIHMYDGNDTAGNLTVLGGGVVNATGSGGVRAVATHYQTATITLDSGSINTAAGSNFTVERNTFFPTLPAITYIQSLLRGSGTIGRVGASGTFTILNDGLIRPGDTTGTPAIGTITVNNGNLTQSTGASGAPDGTTFFNFSDGNLSDKILISGGVANVSGTVNYSIIGTTPDWAVSQGWVFMQADTINYTPNSDNMLSLLAGFGVTPYFYGVRNNGSQDQLLLLVPEPSSAALLALGCCWIACRGRNGAKR